MELIYFYTIDEYVNTSEDLMKFDDIDEFVYIHSFTNLDDAIKTSFLKLDNNNISNITYYMANANSLRVPPEFINGKDINKYFRYSNQITNIILMSYDSNKLGSFRRQELNDNAKYIYQTNENDDIIFDVCVKYDKIYFLTDYKNKSNNILPPKNTTILGVFPLFLQISLVIGLIVLNTQA